MSIKNVGRLQSCSKLFKGVDGKRARRASRPLVPGHGPCARLVSPFFPVPGARGAKPRQAEMKDRRFSPAVAGTGNRRRHREVRKGSVCDTFCLWAVKHAETTGEISLRNEQRVSDVIGRETFPLHSRFFLRKD